MKFIHIGGDYRCFDGNTFFFKNAVDVKNRTTIEKLLGDPAFEAVTVLTEVAEEAPKKDPAACPKCGRVVKQGRYLHEKYCKGK